jgi:type II pantothenate kinase
LDGLDGPEQFLAVVEGVFAGNIFDMGAAGSARLLMEGKLDFFATRNKLARRPWLIDQFDAFADRARGGWKKCVFFVDNAGADFCLGAVPFMRWLARRGTEVILAANERPTLNDMTVSEVRDWWPRLCEVEPSLTDLPIQIVSTGTGEPLIDLRRVSPELNAASGDADLVIIEGMGRGVESNLNASFTCDTANLAMLKDAHVAHRLGGKLFDVVCRFR